ncbi:MAG: ankyrin repeat domain-containing protein [Burkholderiales bacterium]|nr:ankyrin repeat domain-containing protein [Burkholderiales bacterium]
MSGRGTFALAAAALLLSGLAVVPVAAQAPAAAARHERPIHDAARQGTQADVVRMLAADAAQRDARTPLGATPLHHAAMNGDPGPLKALLAAGANPNARDAEGRTPLHMAAFATRTDNAKLLLRGGADPLAKTDAGRDVLSMARKVRADELAGVVSLWILKGCKPEKPC